MMASTPIDNADLRRLTLQHLDAAPDTLVFKPVTTGKHNRSYWVDSNVGRYVLRIAPPDDDPPAAPHFLFYERQMMRQEPRLHRIIRSETDIPIPEIVGHDFSRAVIDRDYVLMRALPGTPLSDVGRISRMVRARALRQVGRHLRALHQLTAGKHLDQHAHGYLGDHHPMQPQPTWDEAFDVMWNRLLDDVVACGAYTTDEGQRFRDLLDQHRASFDRPVTPRLLHMDVWSQNILIDDAGNVTGLVDFDRALWGDVEIEFAVLDYCGISEPPFWEGYGQPRDLSPDASIRQRFYLLYEIQKYMPIRVWRSHNRADAARYKQASFSIAAELEASRQ
jgi:aminoglycoside phosphotransferase (APT) family kinase protein